MSVTSGDILVVDDQPVNVRLLATMLSQLGYKVRKATSGEMALTAIHAEPPDLILLDITMPQMDGYELCEILKKDTKTTDIPVIFVSALDESMDKTKAFEVGAVDYVAKPFHRPASKLSWRYGRFSSSLLHWGRAQRRYGSSPCPQSPHFFLLLNLPFRLR
jgi:CheY-like chemotaxis protein